MTLLEATDISAGYGRLPIVHGVSFDCAPGGITALIGPNGAGKSTLLKSIGGVVELMGGSVVVHGRDVSHLAAEDRVRQGLAFVPQTDNVFPTLSVVENLEMGGYLLGRSRRAVRARVDEVLAFFPDLRVAQKKKAGLLSGGQRNMLAVARALMVNPKVLMLDEPTAGLAPAYVAKVWNQIDSVAASGVAILIVEQNVDEALVHASDVLLLVAGKLALQGSPRDLARYDLSALFLGAMPEDSLLAE